MENRTHRERRDRELTRKSTEATRGAQKNHRTTPGWHKTDSHRRSSTIRRRARSIGRRRSQGTVVRPAARYLDPETHCINTSRAQDIRRSMKEMSRNRARNSPNPQTKEPARIWRDRRDKPCWRISLGTKVPMTMTLTHLGPSWDCLQALMRQATSSYIMNKPMGRSLGSRNPRRESAV